MNTTRRFQYSIWSMLIVTAVVAVVLGVSTYFPRRRALVIRTYDAQKAAVRRTVVGFLRQLESEGFSVIDDCSELGGSGEWRHYVALTAAKSGREPLRCYVEVMGFVSQDAASQPTWAANLPMTISRRGGQLDERFVGILAETLRSHGWQYRLDNNFTGVHNFRSRSGEKYVAP